MFADQDNAAEEQDMISSLGTIFGVSELRQSASVQEMVGAPVLVAEQALVFFAWQEGEV